MVHTTPQLEAAQQTHARNSRLLGITARPSRRGTSRWPGSQRGSPRSCSRFHNRSGWMSMCRSLRASGSRSDTNQYCLRRSCANSNCLQIRLLAFVAGPSAMLMVFAAMRHCGLLFSLAASKLIVRCFCRVWSRSAADPATRNPAESLSLEQIAFKEAREDSAERASVLEARLHSWTAPN